MIRILLTAICLSCLFLPVNLAAEPNIQFKEPNLHDARPNIQDKDERPQLQNMLGEYRAEGFKVVGPVQYLGKDHDSIKLYGHRPVSYRFLDVLDKNGKASDIKELDYAFVLSRGRYVVLIRIERGGHDNI